MPNPNPPTTDVTVTNHGSIFLFELVTPAAQAWGEEYLPGDCQTWGKHGVVVDHRYARDIASGMLSAGLVVK